MQTLVDLLQQRAHDPERPLYTFLADGEEEAARLTRGELYTAARALAALLEERGAAGERALLLYPPGLDFIVAFFGCLLSGTVAVPAYPPRGRRSLPRVEAIASDARAAVILTTAALLPRVESWLETTPRLAGTEAIATDDLALGETLASRWAKPALDASSLAFLQYTSGSTSLPKGVLVSHGHLLHNEGLIAKAFRQHEGTRVVGWLPLHHDMGLIGNVLQPLYSGGEAFLMSPVAFLQQPVRWLRAITRYQATTSGGPNFAYELAADRIAAEEREGLDLSSWEVAFNGSEPVRASTLERFAAAFTAHGFRRRAFFPCYGLAEATLFVSGGTATVRDLSAAALEEHRVREPQDGEAARRWVSAGRIAEGRDGQEAQEVRIVDPETREPVPADGVGEIWLRGPSVAGGYWRREEVSRETFEASLAGGDGPFLRTGDLGFLSAEGELFITGRLKDLVILRGRNHYPQDLELSAEQSHPDLEPAGGAAFALEDDEAAGERLVIVHELRRRRTSDDDLESVAAAIRQAIAEGHEARVADVVLIRAGSLPRTTSGKVQRRATAAAYRAGELRILGVSRAMPPGETPEDDAALDDLALSRATLLALPAAERRGRLVADLRHRVARAARVAPSRVANDAPLTALGVDSLAAVELRNAVVESFGVEVELESFLDGTSLAELAGEVLAGLTAAPSEPAPVAAAEPVPEEFPLSQGQRALWFLQRLAPAGAAYNVPLAARLQGGGEPAALERALGTWLERHPSLRTSYHRAAGGPVQRIHEVAFQLETVDARDLDDDAFAERLASAAHEPFDLERGVFRARLFERPQGAVLLVVIHHLAVDLWSLVLLLSELREIFPAARRGVEPLLPLPPRGYHDFVRFQEALLAGPAEERLWEYWRERLAGVDPALALPTDRPRPPVQSFRGAARHFRLDATVTARLAHLAREHGTTLYAVLLAAFQALLHRLSDASRVVVGSPLAGRGRPEFAAVVGYFVNPLPLDAELGDRPRFTTLVERATRAVRGALAHQDFPAPRLVERLGLERDASRNPLFQAQLVFEKPHRPEIGDLSSFVLGTAGGRLALGGLELESVALEERAAQFDLSLTLIESMEAGADAGGLAAVLQYATDLYDATTAERLTRLFLTLARGAAAAPSARVGELPLLDSAARAAVLDLGEAADLPAAEAERTLPELFAAQVSATPGAVALIVGEEELSYATLAARVRGLAAELRRRGVGPEVVTGVFLRRGADLVVALLAVLEAGGAYLPLDPEYPAERLEFMLEDAGATTVVTEEGLAGRLPAAVDPLLVADAARGEGGEARLSPDNLAYVIYTSGSTGRPKGVAIEHRSAAVLLAWARRCFPAAARRGVLAATSVCFDLSVFEIFLPLTTGGTVILAENALHLPALPARERVTLVNTVPSAITELARRGALPEAARTINLAGEPLRRELVDRLYATPTVGAVYNLYGPSEDTTYSTWERVPRAASTAPSIGRPVDGTRAVVLDPGGRIAPLGAVGEICLGGRGLARGYLGRPALTAERFVPAVGGEAGARLYRTGDLARWGVDGRLHLVGRFDQQVKVRGFRIELGEIEAALHALPEVTAAAVTVRRGALGDARLAAHLACAGIEESARPTPRDLAQRLGARLPAHMVPQIFVVLDALPLTPSGKIDRRALPEPSGERPEQAAAYVPPVSEAERRVAAVWRAALGISRVGLDDNFFELGGHSLLMVEVGGRLEEVFERQIPVVELFQYPTVRSLARHLEGASRDADFSATRERAARRRRAPAARRRRRF